LTQLQDQHACAGHDHGHGSHHHHHVTAQPIGADTLIAARGVSMIRDGRTILDGIDIDIAPREIVTLIGPNGAGKTSLVRILLGLIRPDRGTVWRRDGLRIGYAPQRFDLAPSIPMTVERFLGPDPGPGGASIAEVLDEVGALRVRRSQLTALSGGELQRVVLARALLRQPELLVLDEPVRGVAMPASRALHLDRPAASGARSRILLVRPTCIVMAQSDRVVCISRRVLLRRAEKVARSPSTYACSAPRRRGRSGSQPPSRSHPRPDRATIPRRRPRRRRLEPVDGGLSDGTLHDRALAAGLASPWSPRRSAASWSGTAWPTSARQSPRPD
jgi:zinc transport system ATP-binding protein